MTTLLKRPLPVRREVPAATGAVESAELGADLDRLQRQEQVERNRRREEELARLRELARFD